MAPGVTWLEYIYHGSQLRLEGRICFGVFGELDRRLV